MRSPSADATQIELGIGLSPVEFESSPAQFEPGPSPLDVGGSLQSGGIDDKKTAAKSKADATVTTAAAAVATAATAPAARASGGGGLKLTGRAPPPRRPQPQPPTDDFERFSIQVRRKEPEAEVDLFADMQPVIRSSRATLPTAGTVLETKSEPKPQPNLDVKPEPRLEFEPKLEPAAAPVTNRLDMSAQAADGEVSATGWGDGDWGDDF